MLDEEESPKFKESDVKDAMARCTRPENEAEEEKSSGRASRGDQHSLA